jgi:hypothetical protein
MRWGKIPSKLRYRDVEDVLAERETIRSS